MWEEAVLTKDDIPPRYLLGGIEDNKKIPQSHRSLGRYCNQVLSNKKQHCYSIDYHVRLEIDLTSILRQRSN